METEVLKQICKLIEEKADAQDLGAILRQVHDTLSELKHNGQLNDDVLSYEDGRKSLSSAIDCVEATY
jgi:hypothetical protein